MWTESAGVIGIGYEGRSPEDLVKALRGWGVKTLVDVRLNAVSRKQGFSKKSLASALQAAGIEYLHLPELGNPRENRSAYSEFDTDAGLEARANFRGLLVGGDQEAALERVARLAAERHVAVFCYEQSEFHCHRREVLAAVRSRLEDLVVV